LLKWFSYLSSSDIKISSCAQAYLAFYVINDLRMAQSAKALVHGQPLSNPNFFLSYVILKKECKADSFVKMMGAGSSHNLHLQLYRICDSTGNLIKLSSLVETIYVICTYSLLY
jgi:hypothetical protein